MKRAIALFLAMVFVFTLVPVSALADGTNPTVAFTVSYKEKASDGTITDLSGSASFTREYSSTDGSLVGAETESLVLPTKNKLVQAISVDSPAIASGDMIRGSLGIVKTGSLTLTGTKIDKDAPVATVALVVTIEYRDPKLTFGSNTVSATYPGSVATLASDDSVPAGSVVTITTNTPPAGAQLGGLSGVDSYTDVVNDPDTSTYTAKFTMPLSDVIVGARYAWPVSVKTVDKIGPNPVLSTLVSNEFMLPGSTESFTITEPVDEVINHTSWNDGGKSGVVAYNNGVLDYQMASSNVGAITVAALSTKLYKLNLEGCELVSITGGLYKEISSTQLYVEDGATVNLRSTTEANSYKWLGDNVAETPPAGTLREYSFTMKAAYNNMTLSATAITQFKVMQYGGDGSTHTDTYHIKGATVTAEAETTYSGHKFVRWSIINVAEDGTETLSTEITAANLKRNPISFTMPECDVKLTPIYETTLKLTEAKITSPAAVIATEVMTTDANGRNIYTYTVESGTKVTIAAVASKSDGTQYKFVKWNTNSTRIDKNESPFSFTMPPEDVTISTGWKTYTLTVRRFVNGGTTETYALRKGEYITLDAQVPTGGTLFNYWTHSTGMYMTVNSANVLMDQPETERITVQMPESDAWVTANYKPFSDIDFTLTGAHIELKNEPTRYYALLEYFSAGSMEVVYYPGFENTNGIAVEASQLRCRVLDPATKAVVVEPGGYFSRTGDFMLEISFYVGDKLMAKPITVLNTPSTYIHVYNKRPEYVASYAPYNVLHNSVYYANEATTSVDKDGLVVNLISADHVTEGPYYYTERQLGAEEYKLTAFNQLADQYNTSGETYGLYDIPTFDDVKNAAESGLAGYKKVEVKKNGVSQTPPVYKYYMQLGIEYYDESQMSSVTGQPTKMNYIPSAEDAIWIEVRDNSTLSIDLKNFNPIDELTPDPTKNWPFYSWNINYTEFASQVRTFELDINEDDVDSVSVSNEDSTVAYVTVPNPDKPLEYRLVPRSIGVTKISFYVRGTDPDIQDVLTDKDPDPTITTGTVVTLEVTVRDDVGAVIDMTNLYALNKSDATLYVGNKITLYPSQYSPNTADTTIEWSVQFLDAKEPRNAEYYVKVDPVTGVVEALKYTERQILVVGQAVNYDGTKTAPTTPNPKEFAVADVRGTAKKADLAGCVITVAEIPVYSMTLYPAEMTLYRKATSKLSYKVYPEAATDQKLKWTSTNSNIASVDEEGNVTANMLGEATITATSNSNNTVYKTCKITVKESVLLTEILLNRYSATLGIGDSLPLTVYYTPGTATTKAVTWETSDPSVATVNSNGKIFGIAEGTAIITATAADGSGKKAVCVVSVSTIIASAVVLNKQTLSIVEDEEEQLKATIYPTNVSNSGLVWSSNNEKVAIVDADGLVTGTGGGSAVITATAKDSSTRYADCVVVVAAKIPVTGLALNLSSFDLLLNDTTTLTPTLAPANATDKVVWSSSNANIATVDEKGKVSGVATGEATITATAGAKSVSIKVNVVTKLYSSGTVVNCKRRVNVRQKASGTSASLGYAYLGDTYKVIDKERSWYLVQYNANTQGYIWASYLNASLTTAGYVSSGAVGSTTTTPAPGTTPVPVVTAKTLTITNCETCVNVRSGAGTTSSKVGLAYLNETFTYTSVTADGWYAIQFNGSTAYVSGSFVKVNG